LNTTDPDVVRPNPKWADCFDTMALIVAARHEDAEALDLILDSCDTRQVAELVAFMLVEQLADWYSERGIDIDDGLEQLAKGMAEDRAEAETA
jgi:hypothetical protein